MAWIVVSPWKLGASKNYTSSGSSQQSTAFDDATMAIRISVTQDTYIDIGVNPTATSSSVLVKAADPPEIFKVGKGDLVAFIDNGTAGTVQITELSA